MDNDLLILHHTKYTFHSIHQNRHGQGKEFEIFDDHLNKLVDKKLTLFSPQKNYTKGVTAMDGFDEWLQNESAYGSLTQTKETNEQESRW